MRKTRILILVILSTALLCCKSEGSSPNPNLRQSFFQNYDKTSIPEDFVMLNFSSMTLTHIAINEETQTFELNSWLQVIWKDKRLAWKPENNESSNGKIHLSSDEIWLPDISLYNSAQLTHSEIYRNSRCFISQDGTVFWNSPYKFVAYCKLNVRRWPRDTQKCAVKLGSWAHDNSEIDMQLSKNEDNSVIKAAPEFYKQSTEWAILGTKAVREIIKKDYCCSEMYTTITYKFTLQRKSSIYSSTVFLPALLISFVNLGVFLQPVDSQGRIISAALNFLLISIFLMFFRMNLPKVDHTPYIVILYAWNLVLSACTILTAALVSNLNHFLGSRPPPRFLYRICSNSTFMSILCLGKLAAGERSNIAKMQNAGTSIIKRTAEDIIEPTREFIEGRAGKNAEWGLLAASIDRLSFVLYSTITFILLACFW